MRGCFLAGKIPDGGKESLRKSKAPTLAGYSERGRETKKVKNIRFYINTFTTSSWTNLANAQDEFTGVRTLRPVQ